MSALETKIKDFLEKAKDWEGWPLEGHEGVRIVKMPKTKTRPAKLALEINPTKDGKPMKRKGLFVTSTEMLVEFSELLTSDAVFTLMKTVEKVNSEQEPEKKDREPLKIE